ncbi:MAG: carbohydrate binding domain-containing protein [Bacteroidaceae bacterium]|nr:carbohydrate binding domain-containing protein [Bacteroidaceae bacterium]
MTRLLTLTLALVATLTASANQPDSVFLFSYNAHPAQGLSFAYSADSRSWKSIADGASFVGSDYGTWGAEKKMHTPILLHAGGQWELLFRVNDRANQYARCTSPDLMHWKPQDYPYMKDVATVRAFFDAMQRSAEHKALVQGEMRTGCINRVPFSQVEAMENFKLAAARRGQRDSESLADDAGRFAYLKDKELNTRVTIQPEARKDITDKLIGIFFEDINYSADGGLYAELLQNRDFEYLESDRGREPNWTPTNSWALVGEGAAFTIATDEPLHPNQTHYAVLNIQRPGAALVNDGFDGIVLRKGDKYDVSLFARQLNGKACKFRVQLRKSGGEVIGETTLAAPGKTWKQVKGVITAKEDVKDASLAIVPTTAGDVAIDFVSLFPQKTFKNRKNGLRPDLAQVLADLHPRFMRFPGGCVAHGDGLGNMYHWKETIGPLWERHPLRNIWGYHQTRGLGYFEFFQMCEDLGCEPLPVVPAAVPCQNSSTGGGGQQGGIPFGEEFEQYKQDILDLVEWANGDPETSKWARMRAEAGHPKPFNLKYIGIGNEDLISDVFTERYLPLIKAVKERYPDITVCGTTGPFFEGADYEQGWRLAKDNKIDMVDEHYYVSPGWYLHHQDFYDQYDRSASKVYLGEYASHGPGRKSTIETALTCAMHICGLERNGDIVHMSSYAPLLAKHGHTQWNPDLIYFDNEHVYPTVDYYVQMLCGQSQGNQYLPCTFTAEGQRPEVNNRLAVSTVHDTTTGKTYIKLVNLLPVPVTTSLEMGDLAHAATAATSITLAGAWNDQQARPTAPASVNLAAPISLPAYSLTVITLIP